MNPKLDKKVCDLEVEFLWRRISGKVKVEDREAWDEKAWESLPMAVIESYESQEGRRTLAPEPQVRKVLRDAITVPLLRGMYSDRHFEETVRKIEERSEASDNV
jgi:hypothetical protein